MRAKKTAGRLTVAILIVLGAAWAVLLAVVLAAELGSDLPPEIRDAVKGRPGVIIDIGCGDGHITAQLRTADNQIVQGLDTSPEKVARARERFARLGISGAVSAEVFDGKHLPYPDNIANVIIAEDRQGVSTSEIRRVLAPGGVGLIKRRSGWARTVKSSLPGTDEWTHYAHDSTGNAVSRDTVLGPPRRLQWTAHPRHARSHEHTASEMALVAAGGRIFYIADEGPTSAVEVPARWYLVARDAYNGTLLWQRPMDKFFPHLFLVWSGPLQLQRRVVAVGGIVYATLGYLAPVSEIDGATGRVLRTLAGTEGAEEIIWHQGVLVAAIRQVTPERREALDWILKLDAQRNSPLWHRESQGPVRKKFFQADWRAPRAVVAVDPVSGKVLWRKEDREAKGLRPLTLCADAGRVFFTRAGGAVCVDLRTGETIWQKPLPPIRLATDGVVICTRTDRKKNEAYILAASQKDGQVLWEVKSLMVRIHDVFVINGRVWIGGFKPMAKKRGPQWGPYYVSERDLRTGKLLRHIEPENPGHHHRCYNNKATVNYILGGRRGTEFIDLKSGEILWNQWARGVCRYGVMPAYGLLYVPPHACGCYITTMLYGFNALATGRPGPAVQEPGGLVKGPAYRAAADAAGPPAGAEDWPMYRHDPQRTGATASAAPRDLSQAWAVDLGGRLTQPTISDGRVYVARVNEHTLICLDARTGKRLWSYVAGGRIDSPPTALGSIVVFGARDGYVYALRARDGALAWRLRAAPRERFVAVGGQLESAWPVHGAVLWWHGKLFALAGRSSYLDGGMSLLRIDPRIGRVEASAVLYSPDPKTGRAPKQYGPWGQPGSRADILSADDRYIYLRHLAYDQDGHQHPDPRPHLYTLTDFVEEIWPHRSYWIYGTRWSISIGCMGRRKSLIYARLFAVGDKVLYGYGRSNVHWSNMLEDGEYRVFAAGRQAGKRLWQQRLPIHVRAMVLAGDALVVAGPPIKQPGEHWFPDPTRPGRVMVLSTNGGGTLSEADLPAPPVLDGIAAAGGRLYISLTSGRLVCLGG